jgi:single-stranded-DNA-specific exonuclease
MVQKRWVVYEEDRPEIADKLATSLQIDRVLALLLVQRGIVTFGDARDFFRPSLENLHDPFLLKDMDVPLTASNLLSTERADIGLWRLRC